MRRSNGHVTLISRPLAPHGPVLNEACRCVFLVAGGGPREAKTVALRGFAHLVGLFVA